MALRDLHHIFTAAVRGWEIELARAASRPDGLPSVQDIADVTGMHPITVRERAVLGRRLLPAAEQEAAAAGALARKGRSGRPPSPDGPKRRRKFDVLADQLRAHGRTAYLVHTTAEATGRGCFAVVVPTADGEGWERLDGTVEKLTAKAAIERGLLAAIGDEGPAPEYTGRRDEDSDQALLVEVPE